VGATSTYIEFIATPAAIRWVGKYLDTRNDGTPTFHAIEAAAMRTLERLAERQWPPVPGIYGAIKSSRRLHGISTLIGEYHV
jgi:hypothetical protein